MKFQPWQKIFDLMFQHPIWYFIMVVALYYCVKLSWRFYSKILKSYLYEIMAYQKFRLKFKIDKAINHTDKENLAQRYIVEIKKEIAKDIVLLRLNPVNKAKLARFKAGQFITCKFYDAKIKKHLRCYSLINNSNQNEYYEIAVKLDLNSTNEFSVSRQIHKQIKIGNTIAVVPPQGNFIFNPEHATKKVYFLAGGIGITPFYAMAQEIDEAIMQNIKIIHIAKDALNLPFGSELTGLSLEKNFSYIPIFTRQMMNEAAEQYQSNHPKASKIFDFQGNPADYIVYFCGSDALIQGILPDLIKMGLPPENFIYEAFNARSMHKIQRILDNETHEEVAQNIHNINFLRSNIKIPAPNDKTILEIAKEHDIFMDSGCKTGNCGACLIKVKGAVKNIVQPSFAVPDGFTLACISQVASDIELDY